MRDGEHKTAPEEARERGAAAEGYTAKPRWPPLSSQLDVENNYTECS